MILNEWFDAGLICYSNYMLGQDFDDGTCYGFIDGYQNYNNISNVKNTFKIGQINYAVTQNVVDLLNINNDIVINKKDDDNFIPDLAYCRFVGAFPFNTDIIQTLHDIFSLSSSSGDNDCYLAFSMLSADLNNDIINMTNEQYYNQFCKWLKHDDVPYLIQILQSDSGIEIQNEYVINYYLVDVFNFSYYYLLTSDFSDKSKALVMACTGFYNLAELIEMIDEQYDYFFSDSVADPNDFTYEKLYNFLDTQDLIDSDTLENIDSYLGGLTWEN
jgi:hypothetical protein